MPRAADTTVAGKLGAGGYEHLARIVAQVVDVWPQHEDFLALRFEGESAEQLRFAEETAGLVWRLIAHEAAEAAIGYRRLCVELLREEHFFRRHGRYRYATVREVRDSGVFEEPRVSHYQRGLLLTQVLWQNHARVGETYVRAFLERRGARKRLLEVGPGHGLFLAMAGARLGCDVTGWDISDAMLAYTGRNLAALGVEGTTLARHDIREGPRDGTFDLVVASELLEHVEDPGAVLRSLRGLLSEDGRIFLNVPVNSPAPDHIYLWRSPEEFFDFVAGNGFTPLTTRTFPLTGSTEERAREGRFTISCVVVARAAGAG
ncbi:2-polyprenyl-3-methyl-5-hydroxy-6-metoxy-1,4-benzoquinol methylase [Streptomyces zhaozhouensis]|uniref:2-polyprenyl-3-methyl-5-hydroxy-6-metoxy-1,4-benzoquinol methylase n=1 Tax=Streptomyces zhaozhouensis TaxID=1300267 RepID=A0A286E0K3_9ACTN|nr:class I SAM-dependent methyltransferase [Streptomyces zhaozhouensis]SOD64424.1 2-polyprenyl-3-methyl-5-hydroxy-6-metoxy-1,4-benzoquinol methylase [Streptomyces zhaozhouensis]